MSAYDKQIGGDHYKKNFKIQPSEFANKNNLPFAEGNAIKYICRHKYKGGKEDLKKAKHYIEMIEERDYSNTHWKKEETSHADWLKGYWKRKTNT